MDLNVHVTLKRNMQLPPSNYSSTLLLNVMRAHATERKRHAGGCVHMTDARPRCRAERACVARCTCWVGRRAGVRPSGRRVRSRAGDGRIAIGQPHSLVSLAGWSAPAARRSPAAGRACLHSDCMLACASVDRHLLFFSMMDINKTKLLLYRSNSRIQR